MTYAELLRKYATDATNEGGMWFSGEYMTVLASIAESIEAENAKLRTALSAVLQCNGITKRDKGCDACPMYDKEKEYVWAGDWCGIRQFIRELGVEVDG